MPPFSNDVLDKLPAAIVGGPIFIAPIGRGLPNQAARKCNLSRQGLPVPQCYEDQLGPKEPL